MTIGSAVTVLGLVAWVDADAAAWLTRNLRYSWYDIVERLQLHRLFTAPLVQVGRVPFGTVPLFALLAFGELLIGARRALATFVLGDLVSTFTVLLVLRLAAATGSTAAAEELMVRDGGISSGVFAVVAAGIFVRWAHRPRRAKVAAGALGVYLAGAVALAPDLAAVQHVVATAVGVLVTWHGSAAVHGAPRNDPGDDELPARS